MHSYIFTIVSGISDADLMPNIISRYTIWSEKTIVFLLYKYADIDFYHFHVKISYDQAVVLQRQLW